MEPSRAKGALMQTEDGLRAAGDGLPPVPPAPPRRRRAPVYGVRDPALFGSGFAHSKRRPSPAYGYRHTRATKRRTRTAGTDATGIRCRPPQASRSSAPLSTGAAIGRSRSGHSDAALRVYETGISCLDALCEQELPDGN
jgi:hypothetical protein